MNIILAVIVFIIIIILVKYNSLIRLRNRVKQAKSGIDVYLNQRFDLIPNLVECVKGYSRHEKTLLENIVNLRNSYNDSKKLSEAETLNNHVNQVLAIAENYPELKASEQYLNLQKSLSKIESQLQAARRIYNQAVTTYNTSIETIPTNIVAGLFGFKQIELFKIEEYKRANIRLKGEL